MQHSQFALFPVDEKSLPRQMADENVFGDQEKIDFKAWMGVWGTMLGAFMAVLDIQITNASLREITGGIAATQDEAPGSRPATL